VSNNGGFLDRVLGFFRDVMGSSVDTRNEAQTLTDADIPAVKGSIFAGIAAAFGTVGEAQAVQAEGLQELQTAVADCADTVNGLKGCLSGWVAEQMRRITNLALVDRPGRLDVPVPGMAATVERESAIFDGMADRATVGAVAATGIVLTLNLLAMHMDAGVQVASLGQIRGFQQLIQNVIWATGLADIGGLAFRPQVAASFQPLLERYYNSQSQAQIPGPGDLVRFQLREVFDVSRRQILLGDDDLSAFKTFMRQRGFPDYWSDSYWAAHWVLPSISQLNEMLHRGVISVEEWRKQVRFNDFVPEAIPWLEETIYSPFTRVDARRMADIGLLTGQELLQAYADIGYYAETEAVGRDRRRAIFAAPGTFDPAVHKAEALYRFTLIFNMLPDIRRRLANGFLLAEDVKGELLRSGIGEDAAQQITETLVKKRDLDSSEAMRDLTTSQIVRGTRTGLISFLQGLELLTQLGWSATRAEFLLRLQVSIDDAEPTATSLGRALLVETRGDDDGLDPVRQEFGF